ncbi:hypothetical protein [Hydrogenophaga sp.]|nr:hypothetical protein [Hydrogenophaga sp.]
MEYRQADLPLCRTAPAMLADDYSLRLGEAGGKGFAMKILNFYRLPDGRC